MTGGALPAHYARALTDAVFKPESGLSPGDAINQLRAVEDVIASSSDLKLADRDQG